MEHEVSWLIDRTLIRELTARYGRFFDECEPSEFAETFTDDGVMEVEGGPVTEGREALAEMCRHTPWGTMHVTTDATVDVRGDEATQVVTILVMSRSPARDKPPRVVGTGRYVDRLTRTPDGWKFAHRKVTLDGWNPR